MNWQQWLEKTKDFFLLLKLDLFWEHVKATWKLTHEMCLTKGKQASIQSHMTYSYFIQSHRIFLRVTPNKLYLQTPLMLWLSPCIFTPLWDGVSTSVAGYGLTHQLWPNGTGVTGLVRWSWVTPSHHHR